MIKKIKELGEHWIALIVIGTITALAILHDLGKLGVLS